MRKTRVCARRAVSPDTGCHQVAGLSGGGVVLRKHSIPPGLPVPPFSMIRTRTGAALDSTVVRKWATALCGPSNVRVGGCRSSIPGACLAWSRLGELDATSPAR